jgi:hypothetical protein
MRTKNNTLSVWEIPSEEHIDEAVLAIISSSDHLETIHIAVIDKHNLIQQGILCTSVEASTPVKDLNNTHYDLSELTYDKLGIIADHISDGFKQNKILEYRRRELKLILTEAIENKRLESSDLSEFILKKI